MYGLKYLPIQFQNFVESSINLGNFHFSKVVNIVTNVKVVERIYTDQIHKVKVKFREENIVVRVENMDVFTWILKKV